ncbi:MAG: ral secretion pathway protein, partial [Gammaproteobacteria bacterium]|nr:ral secretion pathway protein [Gammaproteobacteria bacterium]
YLEQLSTREWRRGFDHNMFRELDAQIGAAQDERGTLRAEREQLHHQVAELRAELAARDEWIAKLKEEAADDEALLAKQEQALQHLDRERADLLATLTSVESDRSRLSEELAAQHESMAKLTAAATAHGVLSDQHERDLQDLDGARASLVAQISSLEGERAHLHRELAAKQAAIEDALAAGKSEAEHIRASLMSENERIKASLTGEAQHVKASLTSEAGRLTASLAAAEEARADLTADVERLKAEARIRDDEMSVLMAHLQEARRPIQTIEGEVRRLTDDLAAKTVTLEALTEENRNLRLSVERTKGALEEREFLIRRLERSESNNANVLGRLQTSIERLGASGGLAGGAAQPVECSAELARIDGEHNTSYTLARRTRIGRAPGCELRVESSSVSRHHALIVMGQHDAVIEDLNSTNGVIVNGRKISRQMLNDGDMLTIGEAQFRFSLSLAPRVLEAPAAE